jgi:hypothetical protein
MFRYCLSRSSYAVADGISAIEENINALSNEAKQTIVREIEEYIGSDPVFAHKFECDVNAWKRLMEKLKNET